MPAEYRTSASGMPIASRSFALGSTWLVVAGGPTVVSTAPRFAARCARCETRQEVLDCLVAAQEGEAQHAAEASHLLLREPVLGVRLQARVEDPFHRRVPLQKARHLHGVLVVARNPEL